MEFILNLIIYVTGLAALVGAVLAVRVVIADLKENRQKNDADATQTRRRLNAKSVH